MKTALNSKNKKYTLLAWILAILVLVIAIPLNLIFERLDLTIDMTPNGLYTLTKTTTDYLDKLDADGTVVDVYYLGELEEMEQDLEMVAMYRTLLEFDKHKSFNLNCVDPDKNPELMKEINKDGFFNMSDYDFFFKCGKFVKRLPASLMYVYETSQDSNGNELVTKAEFRAEGYFTGAMYSVVTGEEPVVYFTEGHGEHSIDEMTQLVKNLGNYNYVSKTLNLTVEEKVPDDACMIIMAGPTQDITEAEFHKLDDYLDGGGNLSLLMNPNDKPISYGYLETILYTFCIGMDYDKVHETDVKRCVQDDSSIFMVDFVQAAEDAEIDLTSGISEQAKGLIPYMPPSRSFYSIYNENYTICQVSELIRTATTAVGEPCGGTLEDPEAQQGKQLVLAMCSQNTVSNNAKVAVFGSSEFITDASMKESYYIPNLYLYLSSLTWMYNSDVTMDIAAKSKIADELPINSDTTAHVMMGIFLAAPILAAIGGIVVYLRRKDG